MDNNTDLQTNQPEPIAEAPAAPPKRKKKPTALIIAIIIMIVALLSIIPAFIFDANQQPANSNETTTGDTTQPSTPSQQLSTIEKATQAICSGDFNLIYAENTNSGIYECASSHDLFTLSTKNSEQHGQYLTVGAGYLGTTHNDLVSKYFPDTLYIYRNYKESSDDIDLILLVAADSEATAIEKVAKPAYDFLTEFIPQHRDTYTRLAVFYTNNLGSVKTVRDYIITSAAIGIAGHLPVGPVVKDAYILKVDQMSAITAFASDPTLYSSQTHDAIKNHRHIIMRFVNSKPLIQYDVFRTGLEMAFREDYI